MLHACSCHAFAQCHYLLQLDSALCVCGFGRLACGGQRVAFCFACRVGAMLVEDCVDCQCAERVPLVLVRLLTWRTYPDGAIDRRPQTFPGGKSKQVKAE